LWLLYSLTLFVSAALFFLAQPLCAKMLLPRLGGAPGVWNTCMVFFQAGLLAGYAYAHIGPRVLGKKGHALVHLGLMVVALAFLPIALNQEDPPGDANPVFWLLTTLVLSAGLPFFLLAGSAPLLQSWFASSGKSGSRDPYFLYSASNLGSLLALFSYPLLLEPNLILSWQSSGWAIGYGLLVFLTGVCSLVLWEKHKNNFDTQGTVFQSVSDAPDLPRLRLRWALLALVPSSLMLSVTSYLTTDLACIPLFWVVPLGIYLLTYILAFSGKFSGMTGFVRGGLPLVVLLLVLVFLSEANEPLALVMGLHLAGFFWIAMACHGELARTRPPVEHLTEFYFWLALGGVLGGAFNALLAPWIFNTIAEYPLMLVLACILVGAPKRGRAEAQEGGQSPKWKWSDSLFSDLVFPILLFGLTLAFVLGVRHYKLDPGPVSIAVVFALPILICYTFMERPLRFGLGLGAILLASTFYSGIHGDVVFQQRSFFGVHRVTEKEGFRFLIHGTTVHGQQSLDPVEQHEPLTYYHRKSPIGQVFKALKGDPRLNKVGLIGLGTGALACYSEENQQWTFFEIDPAVIDIARRRFTYLPNARGKIQVVRDDGRIGMAKSADAFGLIIVDAFNSDAIPLHLLTREALAIYRSKLRKDGILAFHISNRYVDLEPVLANLAQDAGMVCLVQRDRNMDRTAGKWASDWVVLTNAAADLKTLANHHWQAARTRPSLPVWTDDFSNLFSVFQWHAKQD
jgi:spermidine synthase